MIEAVEMLMRHWGEQVSAQLGPVLEGGGASPLAALIEWKGAPPRGEPGTRVPVGGIQLDHRAREVEACISALGRGDEVAQRLARLARLRYLGAVPRTVAQQMALLEMDPKADRTYRNWVQSLHEWVLAELCRRQAANLEDVKRIAKEERASRKRAERLRERDRSSAVQPPSAPERPRQLPSE
ncbi:hypothetical protein [Metapseudomonas otitidis]|uniref:hypothetical protein n=1 Tax=Metapseudomonas otitidis TaxID=319939 RepID=UPI002618EBD9|nr:hypothetical protein [Pseudomonas otitidis]